MVQRIGDPFDPSERVLSPVRRFYAQILLFVLLVACVGLFLSAVAFRDKLALVRTAETDDLGWVVGQIETDFLAFRVALGEAKFVARTGEPKAVEQSFDELRKRFDIYFSRVDVYQKAIKVMEEHTEARDLYLEIRDERDALAAIVDNMRAGDEIQLAALENAAFKSAPIVRELALTTLHYHQANKAQARQDELMLFYRFFFQSLALSLLVGLGTYLVVRLWRELEAKSEQTVNAAATLSKAFSSTLNAVIISDRNGVIRFANNRATEIFGWEPHELIGHTIAERIVPEESRDKHNSGMLRIARGKDPRILGQGQVKLEALHKDGRHLPVEVSLAEDKDIDGTPIVLGFIRDISAQIEAEKNLQEALEKAKALAHEAESHAAAKGTFLATMSHEMRTPLHGVIASLELIDDSALSGDNSRFLKTARDCSARALHQVNDILEFTRLGESSEQPERFSPDDIVAGIIDELRPLAKRRGNELHFEFSGFESSPALLGYPFAFSRALYNLAGNAVKFTQDGQVTIRLGLDCRADGRIFLDVSVDDTGIGIAPEDQMRIFNKFETSVRSEVSDVTGTGLGLPIAVLAVEQMGGKMQLASAVGSGSRFYFKIPLERASADGPVLRERKIAGPRATAPLHVLVVDDNEVNVTLMSEMVKRLGHVATPAMHGQEAVELADATCFDVILMDFSMPVMDGPAAARRIRTGNGASRETPIIGVTAVIAANEASKIEQAKYMETVLVKPVGQVQLEEALLALVLQRAKTRAEELERDDTGEDDDGSEIFDAVVLGMGEQTGFRLIKATLADAEMAVAAMQEVGGDLGDRARLIHKAVGSTGVTGMRALSETLSAAEILALEGDDPSRTHLAAIARQELDRVTAIYNAITRDFTPVG